MTVLFVCTRCHCVDAVDLAFTWSFPTDPAQQICTQCRSGYWHDVFAKELYDPTRDNVVNKPTGLSI